MIYSETQTLWRATMAAGLLNPAWFYQIFTDRELRELNHSTLYIIIKTSFHVWDKRSAVFSNIALQYLCQNETKITNVTSPFCHSLFRWCNLLGTITSTTPGAPTNCVPSLSRATPAICSVSMCLKCLPDHETVIHSRTAAVDSTFLTNSKLVSSQNCQSVLCRCFLGDLHQKAFNFSPVSPS